MPWVKLDDQFPDHPKVIEAGPAAAWLYVCGLCYSQAKLTDGRISGKVVARLSALKGAVALADRLVSVGLWERVGEDFVIHDWHAHNEPAARVKAKRAATAARVQAWRNRRDGNTDGNTDSNAGGNALPIDDGNAGGNAAPHARVSDPPPQSASASTSSQSLPPAGGVTGGTVDMFGEKVETDDALPFKIAVAVSAIANHAGRAFGECKVLANYRPGIGRLIRDNPTIDAFERLGAYLAAGGHPFPPDKGPQWLASGAAVEAMAASQRWDGQPVARNGAPVDPPRPIPQAHRMIPRMTRPT